VSGFVYAVAAGATGQVKIGYSTEPRKRVRNLQTAQTEQLQMVYLVPGTTELEAALHCRFQPHHIRGEWFDLGRRNVAELAQDFVRWHRGRNSWPTVGMVGADTEDVDLSAWYQVAAYPGVTAAWVAQTTGLHLADVEASLRRLADSFRLQRDAEQLWHPLQQH
jgi:hypothetical protein